MFDVFGRDPVRFRAEVGAAVSRCGCFVKFPAFPLVIVMVCWHQDHFPSRLQAICAANALDLVKWLFESGVATYLVLLLALKLPYLELRSTHSVGV
jgi:hypothetical protein